MMRVLICEDNVLVAMNIEMIVEDAGHVSEGIVASSAVALDRARRDHPDVVLVDLDLADGPTGLRLVEDLAGIGVPSIIVSGQADLIEGATSAFAVFPKPIVDRRLLAALEELTVVRAAAE